MYSQQVPRRAPQHMTPQPNQPAHQRPRRRRSRDDGWTFWLILSGVGAAGLVFVLLVAGALAYFYGSPPQIASGVAVAGIPVGGQAVEEATVSVQGALANPTITFTDQDRQWTVPLSTLGIGVDIPATMALVEDAPSGTNVIPVYTIDYNVAQAGLFALSEQANIDAVPGNPPQIGRALDIPVMLNRFVVNLPGEIGDGMMDLNMIEIVPPDPESVNYSSTARTVHTVEAGQELALIARMYGVTMDDILEINDISDPDLLYVGQEIIIPAAGLYSPAADVAPLAPTPTGKSIVVSTEDQRIYAYENGQLVRSHLVSTGLPATPTVKGDYKVYVKHVATDMSGPDYFLPQVPYTMYFYQGYGIHGTYWHNSFGRPMSHGCVNLPTPEAEWFFNWAEVGTPVRVI
jgi:lipoprotein-anchoring transpeptidase ErfK/SrfK